MANSNREPSKPAHHILKPTPLVLALRSQLIGEITDRCQQQESAKEGSMNVKKIVETKHDRNLQGDNLTMAPQTNKKGSQHSKTSQVIQRQRAAVSESKPRPSRHARPSHLLSPKPIMNQLISKSKASQHSIHVIDSRSKTLPTRHPDPGKTTKHGTSPSRRSAPSQPQKKATPTEQAAPVSKPRNTPAPKPRGLLVSKPQNSASLYSSKVQNIYIDSGMRSNTTEEVVDKVYPVYEDLDRDENDYEIPIRTSSSKDKDSMAETCEKDEQNFTGETLPALPPKKGSKVTKGNEKLPPLPPRSLPATSIRSHHVLTNCRGYNIIDSPVRGKGKEQELVQDTDVYEPINFHDSDEESDTDESHKDKDSLAEIREKDEQNFTREIPPALPPKKGRSKVIKEDEQLPPLPSRSLPAYSIRSHHVLTRCKDSIVGGEGKEQETIQDTGVYEPIDIHTSDEESDVDEPQNDSLENDDPEEIYITMDPTEYIPPPKDYKPKKKRSLNVKIRS